jgi:hypothetical protein
MWLVVTGGMLAGVGVIVLAMAEMTWSGYVPQALLTLLVGVATIACGVVVDRHVDRPRLVRVPTGWARPTGPPPTRPPRPAPVPVRVHAWVEPVRALPPGRD